MSEYSDELRDLAERRIEARYAVAAPALVVWGSESYRGTIHNISSRGSFLTVERRAEELCEQDRVTVCLPELELTHEATISRVQCGTEGDEPVGLALILHESLDVQKVCDHYL